METKFGRPKIKKVNKMRNTEYWYFIQAKRNFDIFGNKMKDKFVTINFADAINDYVTYYVPALVSSYSLHKQEYFCKNKRVILSILEELKKKYGNEFTFRIKKLVEKVEG